MKGYKGRSELRQYMPDKPEKFEIKFWARCDGRTSYMSMYQLFTGKRDRTPIQLQHGLGYRVVHDLTRDLGGLNHHVYLDRFFTGVTLATDLLLEDIYTCGTLNPNRKEIPPSTTTKESHHQTTDSPARRFSGLQKGRFISHRLERQQCGTRPSQQQL